MGADSTTEKLDETAIGFEPATSESGVKSPSIHVNHRDQSDLHSDWWRHACLSVNRDIYLRNVINIPAIVICVLSMYLIISMAFYAILKNLSRTPEEKNSI